MSSSPSDQPFQLHALANVRPLRPIRVLLAGRESRYIRAMSFLLSRRGYDTRCVSSVPALFTDVEEYRPEVVVLVESGSFGEAVGQAVQLLALGETLSVVVAATRHDAPSTTRLRFVDKEASFEVLAEAVERAWAELAPAG